MNDSQLNPAPLDVAAQDALRAQFEAYILQDRGPAFLERNDPAVDAVHDYVDHYVQEAWEAWQAARPAGRFLTEEQLIAVLRYFGCERTPEEEANRLFEGARLAAAEAAKAAG